jgi:ERCC4-type nuclease
MHISTLNDLLPSNTSKAKLKELVKAFTGLLDGVVSSPNEIRAITGLQQEKCDEIYALFTECMEFLGHYGNGPS